jgi:hypothetical protein
MSEQRIATVEYAGDSSAVTIRVGDNHLELIADETYDDNRAFWLILELWALQHGATHIMDYESEPEFRAVDTHKIMEELRREVLGRQQ